MREGAVQVNPFFSLRLLLLASVFKTSLPSLENASSQAVCVCNPLLPCLCPAAILRVTPASLRNPWVCLWHKGPMGG